MLLQVELNARLLANKGAVGGLVSLAAKPRRSDPENEAYTYYYSGMDSCIEDALSAMVNTRCGLLFKQMVKRSA
jgi:formylmethanofuran dehydrogenase subunit E